MYIRVKRDSVTSILLFIFNVFLVERGIYSVPHDFSGDVTELAQRHGLHKELFIFTGSLQNQKPITIAFKVWPVMKLAARYKKYLNRLEKAADALNNQPGTVQIMTFLYLYGIINLFRN